MTAQYFVNLKLKVLKRDYEGVQALLKTAPFDTAAEKHDAMCVFLHDLVCDSAWPSSDFELVSIKSSKQ